MRIAVAVVVGWVFLSLGHVVEAKEPVQQRSERCLEICNFDFEQCQEAAGSKNAGRCNIDVVRCKNACPMVTVEEPAVPTAMSHQRCVDGCQLTYKKCLALPENKNGGSCAADDVRCEQACPKPPPVVAAVPPPVKGKDGKLVPAPLPVPTSKPKRAARVEGAAAPAPVSATPAVAVPEPASAPPPTVRSEAVSPPVAAPAEASTAAARPAQAERGFFATLGCFFVACEPPGSSPCLQQCNASFDQCQVRESKRGGECNTRLMNCRKDCSNAAQ